MNKFKYLRPLILINLFSVSSVFCPGGPRGLIGAGRALSRTAGVVPRVPGAGLGFKPGVFGPSPELLKVRRLDIGGPVFTIPGVKNHGLPEDRIGKINEILKEFMRETKKKIEGKRVSSRIGLFGLQHIARGKLPFRLIFLTYWMITLVMVQMFH